MKCKIHQFPSGCPNKTKCVQKTTILPKMSSEEGECICKDDNYEFNVNYTNDTNVCILNEHINRRKNVTNTNTSTSKEMIRAAAAIDTGAASRAKIPSSHHIAGGILISICVVLVFLILIIGYRKLKITQRIRNLRMPAGSRQRRRPFYEDVMMSNDNDDPPLI